jgi:hypothetical protein
MALKLDQAALLLAIQGAQLRTDRFDLNRGARYSLDRREESRTPEKTTSDLNTAACRHATETFEFWDGPT